MQLDLSAQHLKIIQNLLAQELKSFQVWAFGSRVKGNAKPFSDLDLLIITQQPIPLKKLAMLKEAFSESKVPFKVDIIESCSISKEFFEIIQQNHIVIQE